MPTSEKMQKLVDKIDLQPEMKFDKYTIIEQIGVGLTSKVYKAKYS